MLNTSPVRKLPTLFLSHGGGPAWCMESDGPMHSIDKSSPSATFMRSLASLLNNYSPLPTPEDPKPIKCILVISAHWEEPEFTLDYPRTKMGSKLVYDYYGFPDDTYAPHLTYSPPTNHDIADEILELLNIAGLNPKKRERGLDHGTFIPLKLAFPEAKIPVLQLSLKVGLDMAEHISLGEALAPLRSKGVLIIGSGSITHNLREIMGGKSEPDRRVSAFMEFMYQMLQRAGSNPDGSTYERAKQVLSKIGDNAPSFYHCHPRPEHFVPLAVAFGAGLCPEPVDSQVEQCADLSGSTASTAEVVDSRPPGERVVRIYSELVMGSMSMDCYLFR